MRIKYLSVSLATLMLMSCTACDDEPSGAQRQGQIDTEQAFRQQSAAVPYPKSQMTDSLERRNLRERLLRQNRPNAIGYVYVLGMNGSYVGYYVIRGKVSSTQSQMTTTSLVQSCGSGSGYSCAVTVPAPGDDGSYGSYEPGIFFFTTDGTMVTTSMEYMVSDHPLPVHAPKLG